MLRTKRSAIRSSLFVARCGQAQITAEHIQKDLIELLRLFCRTPGLIDSQYLYLVKAIVLLYLHIITDLNRTPCFDTLAIEVNLAAVDRLTGQ